MPTGDSNKGSYPINQGCHCCQPLPDTAAKLDALVKACEAIIAFADKVDLENPHQSASYKRKANTFLLDYQDCADIRAAVKAAGGGV